MVDPCKDYLVRKSFGIVAYVCVIVQFLCGLPLSGFTAASWANENGKFSCSVDAKSTTTYKKQVDQACFTRYDQAYNSPLPLYGFVPLSIGLPVLVSVIYSLIVRTRADEIESRHERQSDGEAENHGRDRKTVFVFYCYFIHLVLRVLLGIIFTVLQYTYFYPNGFDLKFSCSLPPTEVTSNINTPRNASRNMNKTSVKCENATASEKWVLGIIVSVINGIIAVVILVEVIYLWPRLPILNPHSGVGWNCDSKFVINYFLGKQYVSGEHQPLRSIENNHPHGSTQDCVTLDANAQECSTMDNNIQDSGTEDSINFYKEQVLNHSCAPDIIYGPKTNINDLYIDVIIHTERARHKFPNNMERHEIYDVYMEVPPTSIRLEKIKDLFHPNKDTNGNFPCSILAIGRPGIGKTVLTAKILHDWANGIDNYYSDKIAFSFKFRWFNDKNLKNISLKAFLQSGMGLSDEKFESIYEEIVKEPQRAIFIFDGLDEFHGKPINCLDQSRMIPNELGTCMSDMNFFIKLVLGDMLKGATVLVTSRPTADYFYSRLNFDRNVEIIGFTSDKIEEYVSRFCDNNNISDLKPKIWNHIKSSSELLNLCYIPVNCFIVCVTLSGCLSDPRNDSDALPTTLTELYQRAIDHFEKHHQRNAEEKSEALKELQRLAFLGMESGQLVFSQELFDEQMKKSGLVNSLSNPIFPLETQFCFIHLTIQEFLAALHVIETYASPEIKKFISDHVGSRKWHLVLQFLAGILGKKIKNFDTEYKNCVRAFAEKLLKVTDSKIILDYNGVFMMKCLREVDYEEIIEDVCETTALNDVVSLLHKRIDYECSPSEIAAVAFVCKHMKKLTILQLNTMNADCIPSELLELLRKRCLDQLELSGNRRRRQGPAVVEIEQVLSALIELNCTLDHKHTELTSLKLDHFRMTAAGLSSMCIFFKNGHASQLGSLALNYNGIRSHEISKLCEVLNNGHCPNLTDLNLTGNYIGDEGVSVLCDTLMKGLRKLNELEVSGCKLTDRCIPTLVKALQDERCQLTHLSLDNNSMIGDKGVAMLFEDGLTKEHCKLTWLVVSICRLTDRCIPSLCKTLQDERQRCVLTTLLLGGNNFTENGKNLLRDIENYETCKARGFEIHV